MIDKQAGFKSWLLERVARAPRLTGIQNFSKGPMPPGGYKGYKGILVQKNAVGVREIPKNMTTEEKFIAPNNLVERTIGAAKDALHPWKHEKGLGNKIKGSLRGMYNHARYKPGQVFEHGGKRYQTVHKRTPFGTAVMGTQFSTVGAAGISYATNSKAPQKKRVLEAAKEGIMFGPTGLPIGGPYMIGRELYRGGKALANQTKNRGNYHGLQ